MTLGRGEAIRGPILALLAILSSVGAAVTLPLPPPTLPWLTETVQTEGFLIRPDLAIAPDGTIGIAFAQVPYVKLALKTAAGWNVETAATHGSLKASLAFDDDGTPWIAYRDYGDLNNVQHLMVTHRTPTGWQSELLDTGRNAGLRSFMEIDAGKVHILYTKGTPAGDELKYALYDGVWQIETIDSPVFGSWMSIEIDSQGRPHIAYCDNPSEIRYGIRTGPGTWSIAGLGTGKCGGTSMALDGLDRPHIAYSTTAEHLQYVLLENGVWAFEDVDIDAPTGLDTTIDVDSQNRPHIGYYQLVNRANQNDPTRGHFKYATRNIDGSWRTEFIDPEGLTGDLGSRLRVDADDLPHAAYVYSRGHLVDLGAYDIRYAEPAIAKPLSLARPATGMLP